ncbi:MAG: hypothetical protein UX57_C0010G0019 [Candidatus Uhrbacteria bacterium GW2011_GWE2_46_68]|uniref:Uncharacterized protein n=2 Tax=Candidatus Uhriibacteriota TaxID=1752732 RepID=A0A0G1T5U2_9BACT|nr:MAG: hypothetical protein UX45_C0012G0019 [Candidatus Uhrbacteria bacterium GW2011_GWF2_46_218]KKU40775.1 MAG: hypothetical protein UX57_C0010G0019 [Candidatus Uhrbacteria bacterium GW2011_GWE2_46_68]
MFYMDQTLHHLLRTIVRVKQDAQEAPKEEVITVNETLSVAASAYEIVRNTLEYDEDHLLRRNAIRRILKRRMGEGMDRNLATNLLRELIWARYFPNKKIPERKIEELAQILSKYQGLFAGLPEDSKKGQDHYDWLLDVLTCEIEYLLDPPLVDEALTQYAYQEMRKRVQWSTKIVTEEDRDLQLFIAIHRSVLKANPAMLRFRLLTLYFPTWRKAQAGDPVVAEVEQNFSAFVETAEHQLQHPGSDSLYRLMRRHAVVFHLLRDITQDDPDAFNQAFENTQKEKIETALTRAAQERYSRFRSRLARGVIRATVFLFFTKMLLALVLEAPYETFILHTTNYVPLFVNIIFPPALLAFLGFTVQVPGKRNTEKILEEARGLFGWGEDFLVLFKMRRSWTKGALGMVFNVLYVGAFILTLSVISFILHLFAFNVVSILFFIFFFMLVAFFGLKIRQTKKDLVVVETAGGLFTFIADIVFLPIVRAGRWMAMRAPRVNIFLFFFDFIVEAPFKAAIGIIESWLAFLREKKEEI